MKTYPGCLPRLMSQALKLAVAANDDVVNYASLKRYFYKLTTGKI